MKGATLKAGGCPHSSWLATVRVRSPREAVFSLGEVWIQVPLRLCEFVSDGRQDHIKIIRSSPAVVEAVTRERPG